MEDIKNEKATVVGHDGLVIQYGENKMAKATNNAFTIKIDDKNGIGFDASFTVYNYGSELPANNTIYKPSLKELRGAVSRNTDKAIYERIGTISKRISKLLSDDVKEQGAYLTRTKEGEIYIASVLVDYSNGSMMGELSHFSQREKDYTRNQKIELTNKKIEFVKETCAWTGSRSAYNKDNEYFGDYWSISFMAEGDVIVPVKAKVEKTTSTTENVNADVMAMLEAMNRKINSLETKLATVEEENKSLKGEIEILKQTIREKEKVAEPEIIETKEIEEVKPVALHVVPKIINDEFEDLSDDDEIEIIINQNDTIFLSRFVNVKTGEKLSNLDLNDGAFKLNLKDNVKKLKVA